jgi:hypothetical protein
MSMQNSLAVNCRCPFSGAALFQLDGSLRELTELIEKVRDSLGGGISPILQESGEILLFGGVKFLVPVSTDVDLKRRAILMVDERDLNRFRVGSQRELEWNGTGLALSHNGLY